MKSRHLWANLFRVALSLTALVLLLHAVGGADVWQVLRYAAPGYLGAACLLFLLGIVIRVFRWGALLHGLGVKPPLRVLLKLYLVGNFFNTILPSGFGGDVVRAVELAGDLPGGRHDRAMETIGLTFREAQHSLVKAEEPLYPGF